MGVKLTNKSEIKKIKPSDTPLGVYKDLVTKQISVFDNKGNIEELGNSGQGLEGPQGPQGIQGPTGPQGVAGPAGPAGLTWRSSWVSGTSYVLNDAVGYNGASYFCISATSGTTTPNLATSNWALLASQGAIGPAGATGAQGPTGATGPAGAISYPNNTFSEISINMGTPGISGDGGKYFNYMAVDINNNILVCKVTVTNTTLHTFPNTTINNDTKPLVVLFDVTNTTGNFNPNDFFTVTYRNLSTNTSESINVASFPFTIVEQRVGSNRTRLIFNVTANVTMGLGAYYITRHKVL